MLVLRVLPVSHGGLVRTAVVAQVTRGIRTGLLAFLLLQQVGGGFVAHWINSLEQTLREHLEVGVAELLLSHSSHRVHHRSILLEDLLLGSLGEEGVGLGSLELLARHLVDEEDVVLVIEIVHIFILVDVLRLQINGVAGLNIIQGHRAVVVVAHSEVPHFGPLLILLLAHASLIHITPPLLVGGGGGRVRKFVLA